MERQPLTDDERAGAILLLLLEDVRQGRCDASYVLGGRSVAIAALRHAIGRLTGTTPATLPSDALPRLLNVNEA